jgi:hypothetical protein
MMWMPRRAHTRLLYLTPSTPCVLVTRCPCRIPCIAVTVYVTLKSDKSRKEVEKYELHFHVICWGACRCVQGHLRTLPRTTTAPPPPPPPLFATHTRSCIHPYLHSCNPPPHPVLLDRAPCQSEWLAMACTCCVFVFCAARCVCTIRARVQREGVSAVALLVVLGLRALGPAGNWCWVDSDHPALQLLLYYVPMCGSFVASCVLCALTRRLLAQSADGTPGAHMLVGAITFRLYLYLAAFALVRVWGLANRLQNAVAPSQPLFVMYLLHSAASPLHVRVGVGQPHPRGCSSAVVVMVEWRVCRLLLV